MGVFPGWQASEESCAARVEFGLSASVAHTDAAALQPIIHGMSTQARRAFLRRGFGPAITARLEQVEALSVTDQDAAGFERWLVLVLDHAGLDASMFELFHVVGGVPWSVCKAAAEASRIPLTVEGPPSGAPAEHAREAVVLTVAGPPDRQRWSTKSLLGALQGLHRRLEAEPALRTPAARPILAGISEDERHLVLRADPPTVRAILRLKADELSTVMGLPVTAMSGAAPDVHAHRPMVVLLTLCLLLLMASLVGKQWQLNTVWTALKQSRVELASMVEGSVAAPPQPAALPRETAVAAAPEPLEPPRVEEVASGDGLRASDAPDPEWMDGLVGVMKDSGATVDLRRGAATVAFSEELLAFAPGEARLSELSTRPIRAVARFVRAHPTLEIWVEGHTDAEAYSSGNWLLGAQRALAVVEALTQAGVPARRVALTSHGEHRPVAPNSTADGRRKNRRVEIVLAEPSGR